MSLYLASSIFATCWDRIRNTTTMRVRPYSLDKDASASRAIEIVGSIIAEPLLGGLHHQYVRN